MELLGWLLTNFAMGFVNIFTAVTHPGDWLNWSDSKSMARFIYYGASHELLFAILDIFLVITVIGIFRRSWLWGVVRGIEFFSNSVGRLFAWAGLLMVLQQIIIVFLQRIFRVPDISIGPFGYIFTKDISWFAEELKLYNAMIVALCAAYTFAQGGHVRVDLFYAKMRHRGKRITDMFGSLFFILPLMSMMWLFNWFFLWRSLVTPKVSASDKLDLLLRKAQLLKWNVETIGFSPNGFNGYFLFKILMVSFAGMMFLHGLSYFWRSLLEYIEGPDSADKYVDMDQLGDELAETVAKIH